MKAELAERDEREAELQQSIARLLEQHKRIMAEVRSPVRYGEPLPSWHEGANSLGQLENSPDRLALQTMAAAIAQLQSRLASIVMRQPLWVDTYSGSPSPDPVSVPDSPSSEPSSCFGHPVDLAVDPVVNEKRHAVLDQLSRSEDITDFVRERRDQ